MSELSEPEPSDTEAPPLPDAPAEPSDTDAPPFPEAPLCPAAPGDGAVPQAAVTATNKPAIVAR